MTNEKVIMLIEAKIQAQRRAELVEAARQYLPLVRAEPGVEAFYLTVRKDDPNIFVFYEIYKSQAAQDFHLQQDFTKKFLAILKSAQAGDREDPGCQLRNDAVRARHAGDQGSPGACSRCRHRGASWRQGREQLPRRY